MQKPSGWWAQLPAIVKAACKPTRALHSHARQLCLDMALLLMGVRPAVLLDYTPGVTAAPVLGLVEAINQASCFSAECGVLSIEGCHLVVNLPALVVHLRTICDGACWPRQQQEVSGAKQLPPAADCSSLVLCQQLIGFMPAVGPTGSVLQPALLDATASQAVLAQLSGLRELLAQHLAAGKQGREGRLAKVLHIDLDALQAQLPLMPTLMGLLLGYPVVYVVTGGQQGAAQASRCLSCSNLTRFVLRGKPPAWLEAELDSLGQSSAAAFAGGGKRGKHKRAQGNQRLEDTADDYIVCAFTVPTHVLEQAATAPVDLQPVDSETEHGIQACRQDSFVVECVSDCIANWAHATAAVAAQGLLDWGPLQLQASAVEIGSMIAL